MRFGFVGRPRSDAFGRKRKEQTTPGHLASEHVEIPHARAEERVHRET